MEKTTQYMAVFCDGDSFVLLVMAIFLSLSILLVKREVTLVAQDVTLITGRRKGMKASVLSVWGNIMLLKRLIIETINDQWKNIARTKHLRYRSIQGFMLNRMG